jgi:hypothetical protein
MRNMLQNYTRPLRHRLIDPYLAAGIQHPVGKNKNPAALTILLDIFPRT